MGPRSPWLLASSAFVAGAATVILLSYVSTIRRSRKLKNKLKTSQAAFSALVGSTPLVHLSRLSEDVGVTVLAKAEFLNPGGSVKDRVAKTIIDTAKKKGLLKENATIFEGTSGSTGISLTLAANCENFSSSIFLPNDQAREKVLTLKAVGAAVTETPAVAIIDPNHYVTAAKIEAQKTGGYFADQFENEANFEAHYNGTAKEILEQTGGRIDGFVASCGTGGTIAGCAAKLKAEMFYQCAEAAPQVKVVLAEPQGSAVLSRVKYGVLFNRRDAEGARKKIIADTIVEGIGINRLTENLMKGIDAIDDAIRVSDLEAVHMSRYLVRREGLFCGSSSAVNCCAIVKAVQKGIFKPGDCVVVILCDSGFRHLTRFYNNDYLRAKLLLPQYLAGTDGAVEGDVRRESVCAAYRSSAPDSVWDFIDAADYDY